MKVAFIMDPGNQDGSYGGAELTMKEFSLAAPEGVEFDKDDPDVFIVGNCTTVPADIIEKFEGKRVVRYWNDVDPHSDPELRAWFLENATNIFTSPLHLERFPFEVHGCPSLVPPPVDLEAFRPSRQVKRNTERKGAVAIGAYQNPGKGGQAITEWGRENEGIDVYGTGMYAPAGDYKGPIAYTDVPKTLWQYETFVHLPFALEPFGRAVVEAWAAGCELVVNKNVGALHWIQNEPEKLESAAEDFWKLVVG